MSDYDREAVLAAAPIDADDVDVLHRLAAVWTVADPVPDGLVERLQFGASLDDLHAEIARMERMDDLVGARADHDSDVQTITFTSQRMTTMVTITPSGADRVRIDGWVAPGGGVQVELRLADGSLDARADADGRFVFEDVPHGQAQFVLRAPGPAVPPVITPSLELRGSAP